MTWHKDKEVLIFRGFNRQSQLSKGRIEDYSGASVEVVVWGKCPGCLSGRVFRVTPGSAVLAGLCSRGAVTQNTVRAAPLGCAVQECCSAVHGFVLKLT